jgi:D-glycero-alpha-D-manno-heptose 1-phosphate guanylyltransferase
LTTSAIILAGGFGTRLQKVVNDVPKPMAPIQGKPFLHYVFLYLQQYYIQEVVLSVGYLHEVIEDYFKDEYLGIKVKYCIEEKPLGTGGGIKKAFELIENNAFVLNGDTFFDVNLTELDAYHNNTNADFSMSLKHLTEFDRYGTITLENSRVKGFKEKTYTKEGWINGGVYLTSASVLNRFDLPEQFSLEKDFLERHLDSLQVNGYCSDGYFIDIGIPEDYFKANEDLPKLLN